MQDRLSVLLPCCYLSMHLAVYYVSTAIWRIVFCCRLTGPDSSRSGNDGHRRDSSDAGEDGKRRFWGGCRSVLEIVAPSIQAGFRYRMGCRLLGWILMSVRSVYGSSQMFHMPTLSMRGEEKGWPGAREASSSRPRTARRILSVGRAETRDNLVGISGGRPQETRAEKCSDAPGSRLKAQSISASYTGDVGRRERYTAFCAAHTA